MKLMMIMVRDEDKDKIGKCLIENNFTPTHIASTGEFLQFGKSIFLLGVEEERINQVKEILEGHTHSSQIKNGELLKAQYFVIDTKMTQK